MRGQGRAGGEDGEGGRACLGLDPHGRLGGPVRRGSICSLVCGDVCVTMGATSVEMLRCEHVYDVWYNVSKGSTEFGYRYLPRLSATGRAVHHCFLVEQNFNGCQILFEIACLGNFRSKLCRIDFEITLR
jgi:hypothetical protein